MAILANMKLYAVLRRTTGTDWAWEDGSTGIRYASTQFIATRDFEAAKKQCEACSAVDSTNVYEIITFEHNND